MSADGGGGDGDRDRDPGVRERIVDQFSYRGAGGEIWRGFDAILDTDAYLNLGYSGRWESHLIGSPQRRLADRVGERLDAGLPGGAGGRLVDVGCGRGGPARRLAERGFDVVGVDLVRFNVATARSAATGDRRPEFLVGDATALPLGDGTVRACTAIDALIYVPDERGAFRECSRVLEPGGVAVVTDLVAEEEAGARARAIERFADAWDMSPPASLGSYRASIEEAGLTVETIEDVSPHSVDRFRKWTRLYLAIADSPAAPALYGLFGRLGIDPAAITERVRATHAALPHLRHVLVVARRPAACG